VLFVEDIPVQKGDVIRLQGYQSVNTGSFQGVIFDSIKINTATPTDEIV